MAETLTYSKIAEWSTDTRVPYRMASNLGHKIKTGIIPHYAELPSNADLADEWDVSDRTVLSLDPPVK